MNKENITAEEARKISDKSRLEIDISNITKKIKSAAQEGYKGTQLSRHVTNFEKSKLEALGYDVKLQSGDQRDPYSITIIKW